MDPVAFPVQFTRWLGLFGRSPQNDYNLGGAGEVAFDAGTFRFKAKTVGTLWGGKFEEYTFPLEAVRNATLEKTRIGVELLPETTGKRPRRIAFWANDERSAADIFARIPKAQTEQFATNQREFKEFEQRLARVTPHAFITYLVIAINVMVFAAMALDGGGIAQGNAAVHFRWGSNFGLVTATGEWWRLFASMFLHSGLMHLAVNMTTLAAVAPTAERLYGNGYFLAIYILSGMTGALASLLWHPYVSSVGASGAVFGVIGASLAYYVQHGNGVPRSVVSGGIFLGVLLAGFNLLVGLAPGVDNMAHLGGLAAGFVLGYGLARPLDPEARVLSTRHMNIAAGTLAGVAALLVVPMQDVIENSRAELRIEAELKAFGEADREARGAVKDIFQAAKARTLDRNSEADRLLGEVVGRYEESYRRMSAIPLRKESPQLARAQRAIRVADLRRLAYRMMADAIRANNADAFRKAEALLAETDSIIRAQRPPPKAAR